MLSQPKINLFYVFGRIEQIIVLSLKQTESDKTDTLGIFGSFILSVKGKSTKLGILQVFLQTLAVFITIDELSVQTNYANSTFVCLIVHLTIFHYKNGQQTDYPSAHLVRRNRRITRRRKL